MVFFLLVSLFSSFGSKKCMDVCNLSSVSYWWEVVTWVLGIQETDGVSWFYQFWWFWFLALYCLISYILCFNLSQAGDSLKLRGSQFVFISLFKAEGFWVCSVLSNDWGFKYWNWIKYGVPLNLRVNRFRCNLDRAIELEFLSWCKGLRVKWLIKEGGLMGHRRGGFCGLRLQVIWGSQWTVRWCPHLWLRLRQFFVSPMRLNPSIHALLTCVSLIAIFFGDMNFGCHCFFPLSVNCLLGFSDNISWCWAIWEWYIMKSLPFCVSDNVFFKELYINSFSTLVLQRSSSFQFTLWWYKNDIHVCLVLMIFMSSFICVFSFVATYNHLLILTEIF